METLNASLVLAVTEIGGVPPRVPIEASFDDAGGTIGCLRSCTLVLPEATPTITGVHASVQYVAGRWFLAVCDVIGLKVDGVRLTFGTVDLMAAGNRIEIGGVMIVVRSLQSHAADGGKPGWDLPFAPAPAMADPLDPAMPAIRDGPAPPMPTAVPPGSDSHESGARSGQEFGWFLGPLMRPFSNALKAWTGPHQDPSPSTGAADPSEAWPASKRPDTTGAFWTLPPTATSPGHAPDDVSLGVAAPSVCGPADWFIAHFAAYPAGEEGAVRRMLAEQNPDARPILGKRHCRWLQGTEVVVTLSAAGFDVPVASQTFIWNGEVETLDFRVRASEGLTGSHILEFIVAILGLVVARICLHVRVGEASRATMLESHVRPAQSAFASYSRADRLVVLHMVGAIARSAGLDVFVDCLDLTTNEVFKTELAREIARRDLFLLFWSKSASASRWVEWEWREALASKGERALQLHPLEPDVPPPEPLRDRHGNSRYTLAAAYYGMVDRPARP